MPNINAFQLPQELLIVGAAVKVGLFEAIKDSPCTLEEISIKTKTDLRALWVVKEALLTLNYLEYEGEKLKLAEEAYSIFYDHKHDSYTGFSFMHTYNLISTWMQLPEVIKTGKPVPKKRNPEQVHNYIIAMSHYAAKSAPQIAGYCLKDLPANSKVLDVGGGPLTYAIAFAKQGAEVTILDLPEIVDMMQPKLDPSLPISMAKGDFTLGLPKGPFDLIYLGNICHIYGEDENKKLFGDVVNELKTGGRVAINDMIRGTGSWATLFGVNMLVNTVNGGTWTYKQYKTWLEDVGLTVSPYKTVGDRQIILAAKH